MKKNIAAGVVLLTSSLAFAAAPQLFTQCRACHGTKAEKPALGTSKVINTMNSFEIEKALKGYRAGTYGGAKKSIMKVQASKLNDTQIGELSAYIPTLR